MDKYFQIIREKKINEKIDENTKEKIYEKYFNDTLKLKEKVYNPNLIKDLYENEIKVGRQFFNKKGVLKYEERFISDKLHTFIQISRNITFIFPPGVNKLSGIIAYRFYNDDPKNLTKDISYFTLVLKNARKYEILEKSSSIKDVNNNTFIEIDLNCLDIMINIIKSKFGKDITFQYPHSKIEILGFIYSVMNEDFGAFKLTEPFYPSPFHESTKIEDLDKTNNNITYIEPILFNEHISLFLVSFRNNDRYNLLIDPSLYHYDIILKDRVLFEYSMKSFLVHPSTKIQSGPCCSIWFIGQILSLLNRGKKNKPESNAKEKVLEVINEINELMNKEQVFYYKDKYFSEPKNLINISSDDKYFISHKLLFCPFLSIKGFSLFTDLIDFKYIKFTESIKLKFDKLRLDICNLEVNKQYYESSQQKFDINIEIIKKQYNDIMEDYELFILDIKEMKNEEVRQIYLEKKKDLLRKQKLIEDKIDKIIITSKESINVNIYNDERMRKIYLEDNDLLKLLNN